MSFYHFEITCIMTSVFVLNTSVLMHVSRFLLLLSRYCLLNGAQSFSRERWWNYATQTAVQYTKWSNTKAVHQSCWFLCAISAEHHGKRLSQLPISTWTDLLQMSFRRKANAYTLSNSMKCLDTSNISMSDYWTCCVAFIWPWLIVSIRFRKSQIAC